MIPDLCAASLCGFVTEVVDPDAVVHTDGWQGHQHLGRLGYEQRRSSQRQTPAGEWLLPRVHRSISNLKAWLHGIHRDVSREHLQVYLDEFVFRHDRRRTPMAAFQTLLGLGAQARTHDLPPDHPAGRLTVLMEQTDMQEGPLSQGPASSASRAPAVVRLLAPALSLGAIELSGDTNTRIPAV